MSTRQVLILLFVLNVECYLQMRNDFVNNEEKLRFGSSIILNEKEEKLNKIIQTMKSKIGDNIEESDLFKIIQRMPKGAALSVPYIAASSWSFLLNVTYNEALYYSEDEEPHFRYYKNAPSGNWKSVLLQRQEERIVEDFTDELKLKLTLNSEKFNWNLLRDVLSVRQSIINHRMIFFDCVMDILRWFYEDCVSFVEFQGPLSQVYEFPGRNLGRKTILNILQEVDQSFRNDHLDFIGMKFIFTPHVRTIEDFKHEILSYQYFKKAYPTLISSFNLSFNKTLVHLINQTSLDYQSIPFYYDNDNSDNIIDAVLLNVSRISYNPSIWKHPLVLDQLKLKQIPIEINPVIEPINEQLLHGGYELILTSKYSNLVKNYPGLSYDYFEILMSVKNADLKLLKAFILNSISKSGLNQLDKQSLYGIWNKKWKTFVNDIVEEFSTII